MGSTEKSKVTREDIIEKVFKDEGINFDAGPSPGYVDDTFDNVAGAVCTLIDMLFSAKMDRNGREKETDN